MAASYRYECDNPFCPVSANIPETIAIGEPDPMLGWISTRRRVAATPVLFGFAGSAVKQDEVRSFCSLACLMVWAQEQEAVRDQ